MHRYIFFLAIALILSIRLSAAPDSQVINPVPIDGSIGTLLAAGAYFAYKKLLNKNK
jgi:hypothetical protein